MEWRRPALLAALLLALPPAATAQAASQLELEGMTFVGTRRGDDEVVLRAARAVFHPKTQLADLDDVHAVANDRGQGRSFELTCERAQLNLETQDFSAEGNVEGVTHTGERYTAPWVRYESATDLLYTDAPVRMQNETGRFRGDGFRYYVAERRFTLLGNVEVVQGP